MNEHISKKFYFISEVVKELFGVALVLYLVFLTIQDFQANFVNLFFNLNSILYVALIAGILSIFFQKEFQNELGIGREKKPAQKIFSAVAFGLIGGVLVFLKLKSLSAFSFVISALSVFLIAAISSLLLMEYEKPDILDQEGTKQEKKVG